MTMSRITISKRFKMLSINHDKTKLEKLAEDLSSIFFLEIKDNKDIFYTSMWQ